LKPLFQHTRISAAINAVPPRLWREAAEATLNAPIENEVITPMQEAQTTQPEPAERGWLADMEWLSGDDSAETPDAESKAAIFEAAPKLEQLQIVKTIGARMREARELCNISQITAAKRFGYANSSKLAKVEGASDTNSVPLWLIVRAAQMYEVSTDYLLGLTGDFEIGVQRGVTPWLLDRWEAARRRDLALLDRFHRRIEAVSRVIPEMAAGIEETAGAVARFREVNPEFDEMKCGARVEGCVERLQTSAKSARLTLKRLHLELSGHEIAGGRHD